MRKACGKMQKKTMAFQGCETYSARTRGKIQQQHNVLQCVSLYYSTVLGCMSKNWADEDESCCPLSLPIVDDPTQGVPDMSISTMSTASGKVHSFLHVEHLSAVSNLSHADSPLTHQCTVISECTMCHVFFCVLAPSILVVKSEDL